MVTRPDIYKINHQSLRAEWEAKRDRYKRNVVNSKLLMNAEIMALILTGGQGLVKSEFFKVPVQEIPLTLVTLVAAVAAGLATEGLSILAEFQLKQHTQSGRRLKS